MNLEVFQKLFQKAWLAIDKKKYLVVFFSLCLCGLIVVFSRVIAIQAGGWVKLSLSFAPIFFIGGLLFTLGVFLIKTYQRELKGEVFSFVKVALGSSKTLATVAYITMPMLLLCLLNWLVLGVFFLLKEIPGIGDFVGVFLSFAPFVLILLSLLMVFLNVMLLFFLTPEISKEEALNTKTWKNLFFKLIQNPLISLMSLFVAITPLAFILFFLVFAALLTQISYLPTINPLLIGLKWFFLMLPFNALLAPAIIFFFNFSFECNQLLSESFKERVS